MRDTSSYAHILYKSMACALLRAAAQKGGPLPGLVSPVLVLRRSRGHAGKGHILGKEGNWEMGRGLAGSAGASRGFQHAAAGFSTAVRATAR